MDEINAGQINYRNYALPLYLLSVVFFMAYVLILLFILIMTLHRPMDFGTVSLLIGGLILLVSCIGTILFVREMKVQSFPWTAGIPLYALFGVIIVFTAFFLSPFFPSGPIKVYLGIIALGGFLSLPWGVAYLLRSLKGTEFNAIQSFSTKTGLFGIGIAVIFYFSVLAMSWMSIIGALTAWAALFGIFHILVLMPLTGAKLVQLGISLSKIPAEEDGTRGAVEPIPRKKIAESVRDIWKSISPQTKRAALIVIALVIVVAAWYMYVDITDTTPCRKWTQVTSDAPFISKTGFTSIGYRGNLWVIGGTPFNGINGEAWYSGDGINWTPVSSPSMVPQRTSASSTVFRDGLWVIGGSTPGTQEPHNDIWYSGDGQTWWEMQHAADFSPRSGHSSVVFDNRLWVIGGFSQRTNELYNDVWYSEDGINWRQATAAAEFSPRSGHSLLVYNNRLWVIGGTNNSGEQSDVWNSVDGIHWTQVTGSADPDRTIYRAVVFDNRIWIFGNRDILWSRDGATWTKVIVSSPMFNEKFHNHNPPVIFENRLWIIKNGYPPGSGIWYTMPPG